MRIPVQTLAAALVLTTLATPLAVAQASPNGSMPYVPRVTVALGYNYIHANAPPNGCECFGLQGGFVQAAVTTKYWLRIAGEVTGGHASHFGTLGQNLTLMTYTAGPQVVLHGRRVETFGQALFGAAHGSDSYFPSGTTASSSATSFALSAGGGFDINLTHHVAVRPVEVQYLRTSLPNGINNRQNQLMLGAGLVFRLGGGTWLPESHAHAKPDKQQEPTPQPAPPPQPQAAVASTPVAAPISVPIASKSISSDTSDFAEKVKSAYFDYDSYELRADAKDTLIADAEYLKSHPSLQVLVAGYADERGTAEYNLALGEKRAQAVRDALIFNGVLPGQMDVVSYGKEVQACELENEACFQKNRRASLEPRR
jgi:peptidoglycan-associated lipoprotein